MDTHNSELQMRARRTTSLHTMDVMTQCVSTVQRFHCIHSCRPSEGSDNNVPSLCVFLCPERSGLLPPVLMRVLTSVHAVLDGGVGAGHESLASFPRLPVGLHL